MVSKIKQHRGYVRANHAKFAEKFLQEQNIQRRYVPLDVPYEIIRMRENGHSIEEIRLTLYYLGYNPTKQEIQQVLRAAAIPRRQYLNARMERIAHTQHKLNKAFPSEDYQSAMTEIKGQEIRGLIAYYTNDEDEIEQLREGS